MSLSSATVAETSRKIGGEPMSGHARARKNHATVLKCMQARGVQAMLAAQMNCAESTVSRWKGEPLVEFTELLAHLGLKVVPEDYECVRADKLAHIVWMASEYATRMSVADLLFEDAE